MDAMETSDPSVLDVSHRRQRLPVPSAVPPSTANGPFSPSTAANRPESFLSARSRGAYTHLPPAVNVDTVEEAKAMLAQWEEWNRRVQRQFGVDATFSPICSTRALPGEGHCDGVQKTQRTPSSSSAKLHPSRAVPHGLAADSTATAIATTGSSCSGPFRVAYCTTSATERRKVCPRSTKRSRALLLKRALGLEGKLLGRTGTTEESSPYSLHKNEWVHYEVDNNKDSVESSGNDTESEMEEEEEEREGPELITTRLRERLCSVSTPTTTAATTTDTHLKGTDLAWPKPPSLLQRDLMEYDAASRAISLGQNRAVALPDAEVELRTWESILTVAREKEAISARAIPNTSRGQPATESEAVSTAMVAEGHDEETPDEGGAVTDNNTVTETGETRVSHAYEINNLNLEDLTNVDKEEGNDMEAWQYQVELLSDLAIDIWPTTHGALEGETEENNEAEGSATFSSQCDTATDVAPIINNNGMENDAVDCDSQMHLQLPENSMRCPISSTISSAPPRSRPASESAEIGIQEALDALLDAVSLLQETILGEYDARVLIFCEESTGRDDVWLALREEERVSWAEEAAKQQLKENEAEKKSEEEVMSEFEKKQDETTKEEESEDGREEQHETHEGGDDVIKGLRDVHEGQPVFVSKADKEVQFSSDPDWEAEMNELQHSLEALQMAYESRETELQSACAAYETLKAQQTASEAERDSMAAREASLRAELEATVDTLEQSRAATAAALAQQDQLEADGIARYNAMTERHTALQKDAIAAAAGEHSAKVLTTRLAAALRLCESRVIVFAGRAELLAAELAAAEGRETRSRAQCVALATVIGQQAAFALLARCLMTWGFFCRKARRDEVRLLRREVAERRLELMRWGEHNCRPRKSKSCSKRSPFSTQQEGQLTWLACSTAHVPPGTAAVVMTSTGEQRTESSSSHTNVKELQTRDTESAAEALTDLDKLRTALRESTLEREDLLAQLMTLREEKRKKGTR